MRNRIDHWCTVEPGNPNPRVHRSSGKLGEASFPTGTVDPQIGISLSPLSTNDGFSLSHPFPPPLPPITIQGNLHVLSHLYTSIRYNNPSTSYIRNFKPLAIYCGCTAQLMSVMVGNPEDLFSHNEARFSLYSQAPSKDAVNKTCHEAFLYNGRRNIPEVVLSQIAALFEVDQKGARNVSLISSNLHFSYANNCIMLLHDQTVKKTIETFYFS